MKSTKKSPVLGRPFASFLAVSTLLLSSFSFQVGAQVDTQVAPPGMPTNGDIFNFIQDIVDFGPRRTGSEANVKTADYIANKFKDFGLQGISIEKGDTFQWDARKWGLNVEGSDIPAFYMRHSFHPGKDGEFSTGPDGRKAEFIYVGNRKDLKGVDVKGKIVVADVELSEISMATVQKGAKLVYDPAKTLDAAKRIDPFTPNNYPFNMASAMEGGAVGFVGILANYFNSNRFYNEDMAYFVDEDLYLDIPGLWVSHKDGETLKNILKSKPKASGQLVLEGDIKKVQYRTVVGFLPGKNAETLMVQSHHDSGFMGAVEDASGVSEVLALAQYFGKQPPKSRDRSLMFVVMDSHFTGYEAHEDFAKKNILGAGLNVVANVTVEHIAREMVVKDGRPVLTGEVDPRLFITSPSLINLTSEKVKQHDYRRSLVMSTKLFAHGDGLPTDVGPIQLLTGMPVISLISAPVYLYDIADTLDKVAVEELQPTAVLVADLLDSLDKVPASKLGRDK
ncbi:M28 family peptidase [Pseudomonas mediterranea]|uniref:M28 family peptidase n=1 Tax=Pseudomonas mediterranea TaxID=183795 RepID=UPI0013169377|nr:M28 family peptidase [Pseudomonas mediterranea]QHA82025.1 M28 family peptidase [Pseudomonas mediterranea]